MKDETQEFDRRTLMAGALGAAALGAIGSAAAQPPAGPPAGGPPARPNEPTLSTLMQMPSRLYRLEADVHDCEVTGKIPTDLNGAFYRVGPDAQYPMARGNIPFDGEGHVSMFRIKDGRVNYRSRFVRNERYLAQEKAGRILFPMYRNPAMDDPSVKGLSRSTANTHIINHRSYLLALKEDSPPVGAEPADARDRRAELHVRRPAAEPHVHRASEARFATRATWSRSATSPKGHGSNVVTMFEFTPQGRKVWDAKIQVPYVGMLHDFAVTRELHRVLRDSAGDRPAADGQRRHPLVVGRREADVLRLRAPRRRRQGPALDRRPDAQRDARHGRVRRRREARRRRRDVDVEPVPVHADARRLALGSGRGLEPHHAAHGRSRRHDGRQRTASSRCIRTLGALPRQDDRYNTVPYRYGFLGCPDPAAQPGTGGAVLRALRPSEPHLGAVQCRHRDLARRVLLRAEEPERAGGRRLSHGPRDAPARRPAAPTS